MSDLVSEMPIFGGFWVIFLSGWKSTNFWGCIIKLHQDRILCESMNGIRPVISEISVWKKMNKVQMWNILAFLSYVEDRHNKQAWFTLIIYVLIAMHTWLIITWLWSFYTTSNSWVVKLSWLENAYSHPVLSTSDLDRKVGQGDLVFDVRSGFDSGSVRARL